MIIIKRTICLFALLMAFVAPSPVAAGGSSPLRGTDVIYTLYPPSVPYAPDPIYIILLIGDGMGDVHRTAARWMAGGQDGVLAMDMADVDSTLGWARTAPSLGDITDSAASGTALATGYKTQNRYIAMLPDGQVLPTILEHAQALGLSVGLVTSVPMAHATPACFAAHVPSRGQMPEIASQMLAHEVDVLLAGGEDEFLPTGTDGCYPETGERTDRRNLIEEAMTMGYTYVCDAPSLAALDLRTTPRLLGLFADEGLTHPYSPTLAQLTESALAVLEQNPQGFFLMVEGGQIDWNSHDNEAALAIEHTLGFDDAVATVRTWAEGKDALIIVTADHETGGMRVDLTSSGATDEDGPFTMPDGTEFYVNWSSDNHTAVDVPVTAMGPYSHLLAGTYENTFVHEVMYHTLYPWAIYMPVMMRDT